MTASNPEANLAAEVMAAPDYQERCALLFDLFRVSRGAGRDPKAILAVQAGLTELLIHFQEKKRKFSEGDNALGSAIAKRLILILKQIGDSIVWRALEYNRILVQLLSEHPDTGYLDDTIFSDLSNAHQIIEDEGSIVLVNDLTSVLRHGDLTIIGQNGYSVLETKYGEASSKNRRVIRQRRNLDELTRFYNVGYRTNDGHREFILKVDVPLESYHEAAAIAISRARQAGYDQMIASNCFAIEALWLKSRHELPKVRPFYGVEHILRMHNLQVFDKPKPRIAPYGIFPLEDQDCFDLMTGVVLLGTTINFDALRQLYKEYGLTLEIPQPSEEERQRYLIVPIAERKNLMRLSKFVIGDDDCKISQTPDIFTRGGLELMHENVLVRADRQLINMIKNLDIPDDVGTRFYTGYQDEHSLWL